MRVNTTIYRIIRENGESTIDFLWKLHNKFGGNNLQFTGNLSKELGKPIWTTRFSIWDVLYGHPQERLHVFPNSEKIGLRRFTITRKHLQDILAHRTLLNCEVMLDIDDTRYILSRNRDHTTYFNFKTIQDKANHIFNDLAAQHKHPVMYWTQNKSYHIGFVDLCMIDMSEFQRKNYRMEFCEKYCCDIGLASNHTIALEGSNHYRSGKEKILVRK